MPFLLFQSIGLYEVLIVLLWVAPILATIYVAGVRGRNPVLWGIAALILPLIALIVVLVLPRVRPAATAPL
jgi:hypothetical protein